MPIEFYCTQCQALLRTGDETAGDYARCPQCGAVVPVPPIEAGQGGPGTGFPPPAELRSYAIGRLFAPAAFMLVLNALGMAYELLLVAWNLIGVGVAGVAGVAGGREAGTRVLAGGLAIAILLALALTNAVALVGAVQMVRIRSYVLGWLSVVITMLPFSCVTFPPAALCCVPAWPVDLIVGLWAAAVLCDPLVRQAFRLAAD